MYHSTIVTTAGAASTMLQQAGARDVQTEVRKAVQDAMQGARDGLREAQLAQGGVAASAATINALQGQITAERTTIDKLTSQLTSGTTDARENAITHQIEQAQERLSSLQRQMDQALGMPAESQVLVPPPLPREDVIPREAVEITQMFFVTIAVIAIGIPLARAFGRWLDRRGTAQSVSRSGEFDPRFDRIEHAIEAIAIEVERVSEGQRFTNKLMSEARGLPAPNAMEQWPRSGAKEPVPLERQGDR
ncbi:MAG: hypothetical protein ABI910_18450 [Gemmatimonadota bacterium]